MFKLHHPQSCYSLVLVGFVALTWSTEGHAQNVPSKISVQGSITHSGGNPVDSTATLQFFLERDGSTVWSESQPDVVIKNGIFSVQLGDVNPLDNVGFYGSMSLKVVVGTGSDTLNPDIELTSVPFALGLRNLRVDPESETVAPNMIGGWSGNIVAPGVQGGTIAGGGTPVDYISHEPGPNRVEGNWASVGGGYNNTASGDWSTISGGTFQLASGYGSTIIGGNSNVAAGDFSSVAGGTANAARGRSSFAAGEGARANHDFSFVWSDGIVLPADTFATTAPNQFLIRATGGVGINTNAPINAFHVVRSVSGLPSVENHVALIDNTSTGTGADVLALRVGGSDAPDTSNAYISFKYNGNSSAGFIEGDGTGGVELDSKGADYAEDLPHLDPAERMEPGDVVGIFSGKITRKTDGADAIMVISTSPIVVGNSTSGNERNERTFSRVAFVGQVPVRVRGQVTPGDFLIPSGEDDGTATAVHPAAVTPEQLNMVFATAWQSETDTSTRLVNSAIGIDQNAASARVIEALHGQIASITQRLDALEARMRP